MLGYFEKFKGSDIELLSAQEYKVPIWRTIFTPWWGFLIKVLLAWLFSFAIALSPVLEGVAFWIAYPIIEIFCFNAFVRSKNSP